MGQKSKESTHNVVVGNNIYINGGFVHERNRVVKF